MTFLPYNKTKTHQRLLQLAQMRKPLSKILTSERLTSYQLQNGPLHYLYGTSSVTDEILTELQALADECDVIKQYNEILSDKKWNVTESISVHHHRTRDSKDRGFYGEQQTRLDRFALEVRAGKIVSVSGKPFTHLLVLGIGGSDLGPRSLFEGLKGIAPTAFNVSFLSNVDPDMVARRLDELPLTETCVCLVSKTGATQETLSNIEVILHSAQKLGFDSSLFLSKQVVLLTQQGSPLDHKHYLETFYLSKEIGGRLCSTSVGGGLVLSLAFGPDIFARLLKGASEQDELAKSPCIKNNMSLLAAAIDIWNINYCGYISKAYVPYSDALRVFPEHLQQLFCECNGKHVSLTNEVVTYPTCPVIISGIGTNAQHSFFQMIHQGTNITPIEFIGLATSQRPIIYEPARQQEKLVANMVAQMIALALGQPHENPHKNFVGNRPSTLVFANKLTPEVLGALLAFYENAMMFQGFFWKINSFDQEGVALGKQLTNALLSNETENPLLSHLFEMIMSLDTDQKKTQVK